MDQAVKYEKVGIKSLFPYKSYFMVLLASTISRFGDSVDSIAYGWMIYTMTGSRLLLGTIFAVNAIPNIILSPFAGVLVDYFSKKKVIIIGDVGRGLIVSATAILFYTGNLETWHLFVFTFMTSTIESFVSPAKTSLIPLILPKKLHMSATSFSTSVMSTAELLGLGIAGFLIATIGISGAIVVDGMTFFTSCILISCITIEDQGISKEELNIRGFINNLKVGFDFVKNQSLIRVGIVLFALTNFFLTPVSVLLIAYVKDILRAGPTAYGIISIGVPLGMIIGGLLFAQIGSRFKKSYSVVFGLVVIGGSYSVLGIIGFVNSLFISPIFIAFLVFFIFGLMLPVITSPLRASLFENTPKELLGRVVGLMSMVTMSAMPLGRAVSGAISELISIPVLFLIMGLIMMVFPFLSLLNKDFRKE